MNPVVSSPRCALKIPLSRDCLALLPEGIWSQKLFDIWSDLVLEQERFNLDTNQANVSEILEKQIYASNVF